MAADSVAGANLTGGGLIDCGWVLIQQGLTEIGHAAASEVASMLKEAIDAHIAGMAPEVVIPIVERLAAWG